MGCRCDNLQAQRAVASLSQNELARQANVSVALVVRLETGGECTDDEAQRIADALGVSLVTLGKMELF